MDADSTNSTTTAGPRRRLSAGARRVQLLDATAALIIAEGVSAMSMERLAQESGVSKALPYKHFANAEDALAALYRREVGELGRHVWEALEDADPTSDLARCGISTYFDQLIERGPVLAALSRPGSTISAVADPDQAGVIFEVRLLTRFHGLDRARAKTVAGLIQGALVGAASTLRQGHGTRPELEDDLVAILGAVIARQP